MQCAARGGRKICAELKSIAGHEQELGLNAGREYSSQEASAARQVRCCCAMRALVWAQRLWRPAGTAIAVVLALLLTWHVDLRQARLLRLAAETRRRPRPAAGNQGSATGKRADAPADRSPESDPDAIEREAREKLHYAKPGEVICTLPAQPQAQQPPAKLSCQLSLHSPVLCSSQKSMCARTVVT